MNKKMIVGGVLLGGTLAGLVFVVHDPALEVARAAAPESPEARLEREAEEHFKGVEPYVSVGGKKLPPANAAHAHAIKVRAFQTMLAEEAEQRDPTFHLKAEAELSRRAPLRAVITWDDLSGNREMDFTVEDSSTCHLGGQLQLSLAARDVAKYPCLAGGASYWEEGTALQVTLVPVTQEDPLWPELVGGVKKQLATTAHLAGAGG